MLSSVPARLPVSDEPVSWLRPGLLPVPVPMDELPPVPPCVADEPPVERSDEPLPDVDWANKVPEAIATARATSVFLSCLCVVMIQSPSSALRGGSDTVVPACQKFGKACARAKRRAERRRRAQGTLYRAEKGGNPCGKRMAHPHRGAALFCMGMLLAASGGLHLPDTWMMPFFNWQSDEARWLVQLGVAVASALAVSLALRIAEAVFTRATRHSPPLQTMQRATRRPIRLLAPLIAFNMVLSSAPDELAGISTVRQLLTVAVIATLTWLVIQGVRGAAEVVTTFQPLDHADNLSARRLRTQTTALTRTLVTLITFIGVAIALMTFPSVRHIGTSLLASAGLAGIVAGLAARPVLGNLIAGLQIGLTQPIRLDDVVVVAGEWGRIEEITGTYVVVKIWDQRRLIVPLEWWTQNPFQNWTRSSASITGQVLLWLDFRTPLEPLRAELRRLCEGSGLWDGVVAGLQVVDVSDQAMQVRCLVSSADSSRNWDLRCLVREGLIQLVQANWPDCLPRVRAELSAPDGLAVEGALSAPAPAVEPHPERPADSSPPHAR